LDGYSRIIRTNRDKQNKKKTCEDSILESAEKSDTVTLAMPFSRTGNMASRIIKINILKYFNQRVI